MISGQVSVSLISPWICNLLSDGWPELGLDTVEHEIFGSFEQRVLGARKKTCQIVVDGLAFAARILPSLQLHSGKT